MVTHQERPVYNTNERTNERTQATYMGQYLGPPSEVSKRNEYFWGLSKEIKNTASQFHFIFEIMRWDDGNIDVPFQGKTRTLQKRDIRVVIKSKRSLLSGEGVRNPCLVKNGKYPPYPPCNVKAVSGLIVQPLVMLYFHFVTPLSDV